ncbi:unnamed protein product [Paramecium primaurelia]|uniref:Tr-type G domain-containing protein n=1 Tax=Paramecium primaurelia TaxID=5886 RepID=A0A8S1L3P2_PARPR|nr:unnamed protein product [Paramecium primaurelia]
MQQDFQQQQTQINGIYSLWSGIDDEEQKRENKKPLKQAHPQFSQLTDKQKLRKQILNNNKKNKGKLKGEGQVQHEDFESNQTQIQQLKYETKPQFVLLVKPNNEEIQIDLEQYIDEQYAIQGNNSKVSYFKQESDFGHTEYKLRLVDPDPKRLTHLTTQMNYRLSEGNGMAYYKIGVEDSGNPLGLNKSDMLGSLRTLCSMAQSLKAELIVVGINQGTNGKTSEVIVRKGLKDGINLDIRILLLGESGSGKTSLLGVLSTGQLDNGQGLARMKFLKNRSEITSGKTERVSHTVIGFDSEGKIMNHQNQLNFNSTCMVEKLVDLSTKLITFIDMGGTKRAHNQMIQIINSQFPDYALLTISSLQPIGKPTMDFLKLIQIQQIPFMIAITHVDKMDEYFYMDKVEQLKDMITSLQIQSVPIVVRSEEDVVLFSKQILSKTLIPIFLISNLKQRTLDYFIKFLNLLPSTNELTNNSNLDSEYCIHNVFEINNQKVLGGTVLKGVIRVKQILQMGPDKHGRFFPIEIEEIQCNRVQVKSVQCGQICTIRFKQGTLTQQFGSDQNPVRRGMVLIDSKSNPQAAWDFLAEIWLFDDQKDSKKIAASFEPVINTQCTRQICKIIREEQLQFESLKLRKQQSKSIDESSRQNQDRQQQRLPYRKQSEQIKKASSSSNLNKSYRSPRRKSSQNKETFVDEDSKKIDLFVISEKNDKPQEFIELQPKKPNFIRLKFKYYPEYITKGMKLIINDNGFQAWGFIKYINY